MSKRAERRIGVEAYQVRVGGERLVVISLSAMRPVPTAGGLTAAEREIVHLAISGLTNRQIAARRGSSVRTVANQLASIYRKLDVSSRSELAAKLPR